MTTQNPAPPPDVSRAFLRCFTGTLQSPRPVGETQEGRPSGWPPSGQPRRAREARGSGRYKTDCNEDAAALMPLCAAPPTRTVDNRGRGRTDSTPYQGFRQAVAIPTAARPCSRPRRTCRGKARTPVDPRHDQNRCTTAAGQARSVPSLGQAVFIDGCFQLYSPTPRMGLSFHRSTWRMYPATTGDPSAHRPCEVIADMGAPALAAAVAPPARSPCAL